MNNIYNMGGNVWEWTTEEKINGTSNCTLRGGCFYDGVNNSLVAFRTYNNNGAKHHGFRITLFL